MSSEESRRSSVILEWISSQQIAGAGGRSRGFATAPTRSSGSVSSFAEREWCASERGCLVFKKEPLVKHQIKWDRIGLSFSVLLGYSLFHRPFRVRYCLIQLHVGLYSSLLSLSKCFFLPRFRVASFLVHGFLGNGTSPEVLRWNPLGLYLGQLPALCLSGDGGTKNGWKKDESRDKPLKTFFFKRKGAYFVKHLGRKRIF